MTIQQFLETYLAGIQFRPPADRATFNDLADGGRLHLQAEPTNKYDPNAVKVLVPFVRSEVDGVEEVFVGYIPKHHAPLVKRALEAGTVKEVLKRFQSQNVIRVEFAIEQEETAEDGPFAEVKEYDVADPDAQ